MNSRTYLTLVVWICVWMNQATIVENYVTFWTGIKTPLFSLDTSITVDTEPVYVGSQMSDIDFGQCDHSKGCFLYPRQCQGSDCIAAVTYKYRPTSDDVLFELHTSAADDNDYIAVSFSRDQFMGQDETFSCVSRDGMMSIQQGFNPDHQNEQLVTRYITEAELKQEGGRLQCRFAIPMLTEVYRVDQMGSVPFYTSIPFDLNNQWYLQLAWGPALPGSNVMAKHVDMPAVTDDMVDVRTASLERGSAYRSLVHAHAVVMMVAWILLAGVVTVVSRHYKGWLPDQLFCGVKAWFQIHRSLALCIVLLTALGLTFIFAQYGSTIRQAATPHAYVGIAVAVAVAVQVTMGILRPGLSHPARPVFNWAHWLLGQSAHILAAVTMFLAFDIDHITKESRDFGLVVLLVWIIVQLVWHLGFEMLSCRQTHAENRKSQSLSLDYDGDKEDKSLLDTSQKSDTLYSGLLLFYVLTLACLCLTAILAFVLY